MSHIAAFDSDPVLAQVQANLSVGGSGFPVMTGPGIAAPAAGSEIMNALIGLAVKGSHAPMARSSQQPSMLGPAIGAGVAGLAVGAGAAAALMGGKGKPSAAAPAGTPPAPPAETPAAKPAAKPATGAAASPTKTPTPPPGGTAKVPEPPTKAAPAAATPPSGTPPTTANLGQEFSPGGLTLTPLAPPPKDLKLPS